MDHVLRGSTERSGQLVSGSGSAACFFFVSGVLDGVVRVVATVEEIFDLVLDVARDVLDLVDGVTGNVFL